MIKERGFGEPENAPPQPVKLHPATGLAVKVTTSPRWYEAWSGILIIAPLPTMLRLRLYPLCTNVAVTDVDPFMIKETGFNEPK